MLTLALVLIALLAMQCHAAGTSYQGYNWYLSVSDVSCTDTCIAQGEECVVATQKAAGLTINTQVKMGELYAALTSSTCTSYALQSGYDSATPYSQGQQCFWQSFVEAGYGGSSCSTDYRSRFCACDPLAPSTPTSQPTSRPTMPTSEPSSQPSSSPSSQPSSSPTSTPSSQPSSSPSIQPSSSPSSQPSSQPSSSPTSPSAQPTSHPTSLSTSDTVIALAVILPIAAGILLCLLCVACAFIIRRRRKHENTTTVDYVKAEQHIELA
eukprot:CAMPEP_0173214768 /NCGR_PEP_ID=MMETSP1141-20130122/26126_1 /TAXON_ID=483371 /ORGANISM="non described non described, Strain CCMP2298" /LENGTH=266 /DNA_ID=CAMNT_0014142109 /DNA_START=248 /DNA_END=1048 /DNA_ORIENTATION=+